MNTNRRIDRRTFLRASGVSIALPLLESLHFRAFATAPSLTPPKRMVFLSFGWGVTQETWFPDAKQAGANYTLPPGLKPLERHQKDFTVIQNLIHKYSAEGHWGSTFYLTGANRFAEPGSSLHNSISVDQLAAETLGAETRFTSLQFGCENAMDSGHGPGLSLAWNRQGKPVAGIDNPFLAYQRLFGDDKMPIEQKQAHLLQKRSALDVVLNASRSLTRRLNSADNAKLDEYFQSIREIEVRLAKEEKWMTKTKPQSPVAEPKPTLQGYEEIKVMYDLIIAALQTDSTRVLTYRQPVATLLKSLGINLPAHSMSHYTPGETMTVSQTRDAKQSELLAYFFDRLKAIKEADGSSLFDNSVVAYGSNIRNIHYLDNCPTIIAGHGGQGIQQGRHLVLPKDTPLCNLWLTLLNAIGLPEKSFGNSTGTISELIA